MKPARHRRLAAILLAGLATAAFAQPAAAWEIIRSAANDNKPATLWSVRGGIPLGEMLTVDLNVRLAPQASDLLGPKGQGYSYGDIESNLLLNLELPSLSDRFQLVPVIVPYVGGRYLALPQGGITNFPNFPGYNQAAGVNYGLRLFLGLPLNLVASAYLGGTTLLWGNWKVNDLQGEAQSGPIGTGGMTLPTYGAALRWTLGDFLSLYVGLEQSQLPLGLTGTPTALTEDRTVINTLKAGLSFPFFSL